jgi:flagellar protein FlaG
MTSVDGVRSDIQTAAATPSPIPVERLPENRALIQAVKALNATEFYGQDNELTFGLDRQSRRPVVRLVNRKTKEVIRQIPAEYVLRMREDIKDSAVLGH